MPFLEARVFLSAEDNRVRLPDQVAAAVQTRDRDAPEDRNTGRGIVDALTRWTAESPPRFRVDRPVAKALTRAMEEVGIRQSQRARKVGDYRLDELLYEGPSYQDWAATHVALEKERARVRIYVVEPGASEEAHASIVKAAKREYAILNGISHPGILRARGYTEHERGPALIYDYLPGSQRLDHYLSERGERLSAGNRLDLIREIAEALRYAHSKRICHRALSPQNILILDPEASSPHIQIFNWQTAARERAGTRVTSLGYSMTSHLANLIEEASAVYMAPEALAERGDAGEQADVFSLGALAYHLFAGTAPARSFYELGEKLREGKGAADLLRARRRGGIASIPDPVQHFPAGHGAARFGRRFPRRAGRIRGRAHEARPAGGRRYRPHGGKTGRCPRRRPGRQEAARKGGVVSRAPGGQSRQGAGAQGRLRA